MRSIFATRSMTPIIVLLIALLPIVLMATPVYAGGVVGNGTPGSCTETTLNTAVAGGGTVTFNCGGPKTILVTHPMTVTQSTVIQGGGIITITGGLTTLLFHVLSPAALTLNDIALDSAYNVNGDGGAIVSSGPLSLNNVTIQYSQTTNLYCGGAIWTSGIAYISNSTFYKNTGGSGGGAVCSGVLGTANLQITNSSFTQNKTTNTTYGFGGAILMNSGVITLTDTAFASNQAQFGGAIYVDQAGTATLRTQNTATPTYFLGNYASDSGGAVLSKGTLSVSGVQFNGNIAQNVIAAGYGGAIASIGALTLSDSSFSINSGRYGGALLVGETFNITGTARADIQRTSFFKNTASKFGGGIYTNLPTAVVTVTNSVFDQNSAASGGGVRRFNALLKISNSSFTSNQSTGGDGGGLSIYYGGSGTDPTSVSATSVTFSGNTASNNQGGGIYNGGYSVFKNLTLKNNINGIFSAGIVTHLANSVLDNPGSLNCDGNGQPIVSDGPNLSTDNSCAVAINGTPAQLGTLVTNNNGVNQTKYHLPLAGSPLINAAANCPTLDQRGALRVGACDIGAVEYGGLFLRLFLPLIVK